MRILFQNDAINAALSALHVDSNYPLSNLNHSFLKKIFKSTQNTDTVTITFSTVKSINCVYVGFTNATSITARMYDISSVLLSTEILNMDKPSSVFTPVGSVKYITLTFAAAAAVYVGTIGTGLNYTMPNPNATVVKDYVDNSSENSSADGQYMINKIEWLRKVPASFYVYDLDEYNLIYAAFSSVDRPVWVDFYEETVNAINPIYGIVKLGTPKKTERIFSFDLTVTEAR